MPYKTLPPQTKPKGKFILHLQKKDASHNPIILPLERKEGSLSIPISARISCNPHFRHCFDKSNEYKVRTRKIRESGFLSIRRMENNIREVFFFFIDMWI